MPEEEKKTVDIDTSGPDAEVSIEETKDEAVIETENTEQETENNFLKKSIKQMAILFASAILLTSCFSYTSVVGTGAEGNKTESKWNHYAIGGLAPIAVSDSKEMANGAENYDVKTEVSFVNSLCRFVTFGLYTPSTTTVTK